MSKNLDTVLAENQSKYHEGSWKNYTEEELEWWVKLFSKRATHRSDPAKKLKDFQDAANYQLMLDAIRKVRV